MIKKLEIQNFQSHQNSSLSFHPNINIIIGQSDSGKTAIVRALRWLIFNKPGGDSIRSNWGGETKVSLTVEDSEISRVRTNSKNAYQMDGKEFVAFGNDVPDEIQSAIKISSTNIQQQLDSSFLISESSGNVASHFNQISHLDTIDHSLYQINRWSKEISSKLSKLSEDKKLYQIELDKFSFIEAMEEKIKMAEELESDINRYKQQLKEIKNIIYKIQEIKSDMEMVRPKLAFENRVIHGLSQIDSIDSKRYARTRISNMISAYQSISNGIKRDQTIVNLEDKALLGHELIKKHNEAKEERSDLNKTIFQVIKLHADIEAGKERLIEKQNELKLIMPDICPLCGSGVK